MVASTVAQYLAALPADRRAALRAVRKAINQNLPEGYEEGMQFGMIGWYVPLSLYPAGYGENPKVPLPLVALASQKPGMVLHFLCLYGNPTLRDWFISEWSAWELATGFQHSRILNRRRAIDKGWPDLPVYGGLADFILWNVC